VETKEKDFSQQNWVLDVEQFRVTPPYEQTGKSLQHLYECYTGGIMNKFESSHESHHRAVDWCLIVFDPNTGV
jgi:hypothetical protein